VKARFHAGPPNGTEMSRPASQAQYRAEIDTWLAGSAPSSCWADGAILRLCQAVAVRVSAPLPRDHVVPGGIVGRKVGGGLGILLGLERTIRNPS